MKSPDCDSIVAVQAVGPISLFSFSTVNERIPIISIPSEVESELDSDEVIGGY